MICQCNRAGRRGLLPFTLLLVILPWSLGAQVSRDELYQQLEDQNPALFSAALGDDSLELFLTGFWKTGLGLGLSSETPPVDSYGFVPWYNQVNLLLSLRYAENWFLDATVEGQDGANTLVLGWEDPQGTGLRRLAAGNQDIGPRLPWTMPGITATGTGIPGVHAMGVLGSLPWETWLRVSRSEPVTEHFSGAADGAVATFPIRGHTWGTTFFLPHRSVQDVELMLEDRSGILGSDGRRYRPALPSEILDLDGSLGRLRLKKRHDGRVLVRYTANGSAWNQVGGDRDIPSLDPDGLLDWENPTSFDAPALTNFDAAYGDAWRSFYGQGASSGLGPWEVAMEGRSFMILHQPGWRGPFDGYGDYALESSLSTGPGLGLIQTDTGTQPRDAVFFPDFAALGPDSGTWKDQYPLADAFPAEARHWYSPGGSWTGSGSLTLASLDRAAPGAEASAGHVLGRTPLPGTVKVYRDGQEDPSFIWDPLTNKVSSPLGALATDRLTVSYQTADPEGSESHTEVFWGVQGGDSLQAAILVRLPPPGDGDALETTRTVVQGQVASQNKVGTWSWDLQAWSVLAPGDPGEALAASGFGEESWLMDLDFDLVGPGPSSGIAGGPNARGELRYRDFRKSGGLRQFDDGGVDPAESYNPGKPLGPNLAAHNWSEVPGNTLLHMDTDLGNAEWVSALRYWTPADREIIKTAQALVLWVAEAGTGSIELRVQGGAFGEDSDDDGFLDLPDGQGTLAFHHQGNPSAGLVSRPHSSLARLYGEDINRNGRLDPPGPWKDLGLPVTITGTTASPQAMVFPLGPELREVLLQGEGLRFVLESAGGYEGTILIGGLSLQGPAFWTVEGDIQTGNFVGEAARSDEALIRQTYPRVSQGGDGDGVQGRVAMDDSSPHRWRKFLPRTAPGTHRYLTWVVRSPTALDLHELILRDREGGIVARGAGPSIPGSAQWVRVEMDLLDQKTRLFQGETEVFQGDLEVRGSLDRVVALEIEAQGSGGSEYRLDDIQYWHRRTTLGIGALARASLAPDWELKGPGGTILLDRVSLDLTLDQGVQGPLDRLGESTPQGYGRVDTAFRLLGLELGLGGQASHTGDQGLNHGMAFRIPGLTLSETLGWRWNRGSSLGGSHRLALSGGMEDLTWAVSGSTGLGPDLLTQAYVATFDLAKVFSLDAEIRQIQDRPTPLPQTYPEAWGESWMALVTWDEAERVQRQGTWKPTLSLERGPWKITIDGTWQGSIGNPDEGIRHDRYQNHMGLGYSDLKNDLALSIDWKGDWELSLPWTESWPGQGFLDLWPAVARIHADPALFPLVDLFAPAPLLPVDAEQATKVPSLSVDIKRKATSPDFWWPRNIRVDYRRLLGYQGDLAIEEERALGIGLAFSNINRWGRLGSQGGPAWFDTDEQRLDLVGGVDPLEPEVFALGAAYRGLLVGIGPRDDARRNQVLWSATRNLLTVEAPGTLAWTLGSAVRGDQNPGHSLWGVLETSWNSRAPQAWDLRPAGTSRDQPIFFNHIGSLRVLRWTGDSSATEKESGPMDGVLEPVTALGPRLPSSGFQVKASHASHLFWPGFAYFRVAARLELYILDELTPGTSPLGIGTAIDLEARVIF